MTASNQLTAMPAAPALNATIHKQALLLAEEARRTDPNIIKFYWFPADNEVRLVEDRKERAADHATMLTRRSGTTITLRGVAPAS